MKHKTIPKDLKNQIKLIRNHEYVNKVIIGPSESCRHTFSPGSIRIKRDTDNGFKIVYDMDVDKPLANGFYFTFSYPGFTGSELLEELLYYGISAISLEITGSDRIEGIRACVSQTGSDRYNDLEYRLKAFHKDHGKDRWNQ